MEDSNNEKTILGIETHPVPFVNHRSISVKREDALAVILDSLKNYQDHEFHVTPLDYGLMVSVNYENGVFQSMILKGAGEQGERINDSIATMLMPKESKSKKKITLHALLTVQNVNRFSNGIDITEVPRVLKLALRNGFKPYDNKHVVCRPIKLYIDGVRSNISIVWREIGNMVITAFAMEYDYERLKRDVVEDFIKNDCYLLPQHGLIIDDSDAEKDGAFPETHFLFDDIPVVIEQKED